ncbi:MAG TPA: hypothetical protein VE615_08390 [Gaiellaceae bacterium]|nr:hypothetical protein [Gaiellaceae bacterium]
MARRWLPIGMALLAACLDAAGFHLAAFYIVLAAVPTTAIAALGSLGELLDSRAEDRAGPGLYLQPVLSALAVLLLVSGAAIRAPAVGDSSLPALAGNALTACLSVLVLEALVAVFAEPRPARRPATDLT